jgi:TPR repeat protein
MCFREQCACIGDRSPGVTAKRALSPLHVWRGADSRDALRQMVTAACVLALPSIMTSNSCAKSDFSRHWVHSSNNNLGQGNKMQRAILFLCGLFWYSFAAAGYDEAMAAYAKGDFNTALVEFQPLADRGDAASQYHLGLMYDEGEGVPRDSAKGVEWFRKAAEQGYANAEFELGYMYILGRGIAQDFKTAAAWFLKAAEQNHSGAQYLLGGMYYQGKGVPQDNTQSYMWYSLASASGDKNATLMCTLLAARMAPGQKDEAEKMAREWSAKHPKANP